MSRSAGTGSPVWFRCSKCRSTVRGSKGGWAGDVTLTGRERKTVSFRRRYSCLGTRSTCIDREYRCECGHVGWSNHIDLAFKVGAGRYDKLD